MWRVTKELGLSSPPAPENYMRIYFGALVAGDLVGGLAGQMLRTRRRVIVTYILMLIALSGTYLWSGEMTTGKLTALIAGFGFFSAYTVLSFTVAAEQFGTNLRATAATITPNLVRASAIVFTLSFGALKAPFGVVGAATIIGTISLTLALFSALRLEETYGKDLDYLS